MKKILVLLAIVMILTSCDNTLNLNEDWKDIPVTYGILNPSDTAQYIRVERVFIDQNSSAFEVAKIADSIYYKDITVSLIRNKTDKKYDLNLIDGNTDGHIRDTGIFTNTPNYLYKINTSDIELNPSEDYTLLVTKENGDTITMAKTRTLKDVVIYIPSSNALSRPVKLEYDLKRNTNWDKDPSAGYYDLILIINYKEKDDSEDAEWVKKSLEWKVATGITSTKYKFLGKDFFIFLKNNLKVEDNIIRKFSSFDIKVRSVGKELKNYTDILNSNLGITSSQQIPTYTNMSNGFGVFTSINFTEMKGFFLSDETLDTLSTGIYTKDLNFE